MPELIIEAFRECKTQLMEKELSAAKARAEDYRESVVDKVVREMCKETLSAVLSQQVNAILGWRKPAPVSDPLALIAEAICLSVSRDASKDIVRSALKETAQEYVVRHKEDELLFETVLTPLVREFAVQAYDQCIAEVLTEEIIRRQVNRVVEPVCLQTIEGLSDEDDRDFLEGMFQSFMERQLDRERVPQRAPGASTEDYELLADLALQDAQTIEGIEASLLGAFRLDSPTSDALKRP